MDAPFRRLRLAASLSAIALCGCGLFDHHTRCGGTSEAEPEKPTKVETRGQMPVAPTAPLVLPQTNPLPTPSLTATVSTAPSAAVIPAGLGQPQVQTQVKVVATVAGELIVTDDEVIMMMKERAGDFVNLAGEEREKKEKQVYREELRKLIERELILHDFIVKIRKNKPAALDEVWEQARQSADRQIREFRRLAKLENEETFTQYMRFRGTDAVMFKRFFERTACMSIFLNSLLKESGRGVALVQIEDYYRSFPKEFQIAERIRWQHLFVSTSRFATPADAKLYAEWLQKSVKEGRDVAALAKEYGHGDSALRSGEGIGDKPGEIRPTELEPALLAMKADQVSELIQDANGIHIVKVQERVVAGTKPLDETLQLIIRNKLTERAMKLERDRIVTDLWRKHTVVIAE